MPIHKMNLENGVFFTKQVGYIDNVDARMWANALKNHAHSSDFPIMAVVDARDVERLCPTSIKVIAKVLQSPNVLGVALVAGDLMASRNAAVMNKLGELQGVAVFSTMDEALRFSRTRVAPSFGAFSPHSISALRMAAAW